MAGNSIVGSFGLNLTPLKRDFLEAARIAKAGSAKVAAAVTQAAPRGRQVNWQQVQNLSQSFNQPTAAQQRARRNSAAGYRPAPAGKYAMDEEESPSRGRRGGGAFGMVGAASAIGGLATALSAWKQVNDEALELRDRVQEITKLTGSGSFRGIGDMQSKLKDAADALADMRKQTTIETQGGAKTPSATFGHLVRRARQIATGDSDEKEEERKTALRRAASKAIDDMADKQGLLNDVEREGVFGSERQAAVLKEEIEYRERLGALASAESAAGLNNPAARNAENARHDIALTAINREHDLREAEVALETRLNGLTKQGLTTAQQTTASIKERLAAKRAELATTPPANYDKQNTLKRDITGLESEQFEDDYQRKELNKGAQGAVYRRQQRKEERSRTAFAAVQSDAALMTPNGRGGGLTTGGLTTGGLTAASMASDADTWRATFKGGEKRPVIGSKEVVERKKAEQEERRKQEEPLTSSAMDNLLNKYWGN